MIMTMPTCAQGEWWRKHHFVIDEITKLHQSLIVKDPHHHLADDCQIAGMTSYVPFAQNTPSFRVQPN